MCSGLVSWNMVHAFLVCWVVGWNGWSVLAAVCRGDGALGGVLAGGRAATRQCVSATVDALGGEAGTGRGGTGGRRAETGDGGNQLDHLGAPPRVSISGRLVDVIVARHAPADQRSFRASP
jgi:hypothetical protein